MVGDTAVREPEEGPWSLMGGKSKEGSFAPEPPLLREKPENQTDLESPSLGMDFSVPGWDPGFCPYPAPDSR